MRGEATVFDWHTIGATAGYTSIDKKLIPRSVYGFGEEYRMYKDWSRYQSTLMGTFQLGDKQELNSMLYLDVGQDTYQTYLDAGYHNMDITSTMKYRTLGFNLRLQWQINDNAKLQYGLRTELMHSTRKDNGNYLVWTPHNLGLTDVFSQLEYILNQQVNLSGGLGIAFFKTDMREKISVYAEPSAGLYYTFHNGATASAAVGFNSSYPTMRQLFSSDKGNPDLEPQYSGKYELSANQPYVLHSVPVSLGGSVYYNDIHNLIDERNGKYANINRVKSYGSEWDLAMQPFRWWELETTYAWLQYDRSSAYKLTESPANSVDISSVFRLPAKLSLSFTSAYQDNRLSEDAAFNYHALPAYWTHSLELKKSWQNYRINLGLENITDTYYEEEYGFPAPGIDFHLGLEAQI